MKNSDMPAMPFVEPEGTCNVNEGLTKREHFAAMAMQGILSNPYWFEQGYYGESLVGTNALKYADALLAELERAK